MSNDTKTGMLDMANILRYSTESAPTNVVAKHGNGWAKCLMSCPICAGRVWLNIGDETIDGFVRVDQSDRAVLVPFGEGEVQYENETGSTIESSRVYIPMLCENAHQFDILIRSGKPTMQSTNVATIQIFMEASLWYEKYPECEPANDWDEWKSQEGPAQP